MHSHDRYPRDGFTLVEVMVALVIGAMLLLGARLTLDQLTDAAHRAVHAGMDADRQANRERLLRDIVTRTEAASETTPFRGTWRQARFVSWCDTPAGWLERCAATLTVTSLDSVRAIRLHTSTGDTCIVRRAGTATILYLLDAGAGGHWVTHWSSTTDSPLAIGLVTDRDTTILPIGERR